MPRQKLTDAFVKSAKPINGKLTEYADERENGLCLRVTPAGIKSWTYRYRLKSGQQKECRSASSEMSRWLKPARW